MPGTATEIDVEVWLDDHWDPDRTVSQWWADLAAAGLSNPMLPPPWGRGWDRTGAMCFADAMQRRGALGPPSGIGMMLAVPTLLAHGSPEVIERYVPKILNGRTVGASYSASLAPAPTSRACRRPPCATASSGSSTGRRSGPLVGSTQTSGS
ncbi:MAG: acyl-CoA dehydrogenase family protein [Actinomycetota bacterium]